MGKKRTGPRLPKSVRAAQRPGSKPKIKTSPQVDFAKIMRPLTEAASENGPAFFRTDLDDATAVITASAVLEKILEIIIMLHIGRVPSTASINNIFRYPGPLSSFSSKIDLCFLMGHLLPDMKADLDNIRHIRNEFCHTTKIRSFDDADIKIRCERLRSDTSKIGENLAPSLSKVYGEHKSAGRNRFSAATLALIILLIIMVMRKLAQIEVISANSALISKITSERFDAFMDEIRKDGPNSAEDSPVSPSAESAHEKIPEEQAPPPPASQE